MSDLRRCSSTAVKRSLNTNRLLLLCWTSEGDRELYRSRIEREQRLLNELRK
jgi:hypothetical protein